MALTRRRLLTGSAYAAGGFALSGMAKPRALFAAENADVIVIGAGFSGLHAAMMLKDEGFNVIVLEATDRVGGTRIHR